MCLFIATISSLSLPRLQGLIAAHPPHVQSKTCADVELARDSVEICREAYDNAVVEDRVSGARGEPKVSHVHDITSKRWVWFHMSLCV